MLGKMAPLCSNRAQRRTSPWNKKRQTKMWTRNSPSPTTFHTTPSKTINLAAVLILKASIRHMHGPMIVRLRK